MATALKTGSSTPVLDIADIAETSSSSSTNDLQRFINLRALKLMNEYCYRVKPSEVVTETTSVDGGGLGLNTDTIHMYCRRFDEYVRFSSATAKNVELLQESERLCSLLNGIRVTFCKSGKDRTGMGVTLEQSRELGERFGCGQSQSRLLRDAQLMREYGCRVLIAEKNIGRKVYSINSLQAQFIPLLYRPPTRVQENLMKGGDLS